MNFGEVLSVLCVGLTAGAEQGRFRNGTLQVGLPHLYEQLKRKG